MKFLHAADVHLDSPLRGLVDYPGAPVERLRSATRRAMDNLVRLAVDERVDFLLIAGDLFDTECRDFNSALAAVAQMQRLHKAGIPVYMILGNHDSREEMTREIPWPPNVKLFGADRPETVLHAKLPLAVHGMSYPCREVTENLAIQYPAPVMGRFNIGLLHTNAGGNPNHDSYAPTSVEELIAKRYDYWALGHIHQPAVLHESPHIVYSGNTQGRHARELGAKGCYLVAVNDGRIETCEFRETDVARWFRETITLEPDDDSDELIGRARDRLEEVIGRADGRLAAVRLEFTGRAKRIEFWPTTRASNK